MSSVDSDASSSSSSSSSSLRHIRPILPAHPPPRDIRRDIITTSRRTFIPPKNVHVKAACDACRKRKVKCSGGRPRCIACDRANSECNYISAPAETHVQALKRKFGELQERHETRVSDAEELCHLLCTMPEAESISVLRRLREDCDVAGVVREVKGGCLLLQLGQTRRKAPKS